jgi:ElaB/YqjD/DUF883 family membrane-anchored ribosome-binding protein
MGKTSDQINDDIEETRETLKSNLEELEARVKSATDWRRYVKRHPKAMVAAALASGVLLSTLIGKSRNG